MMERRPAIEKPEIRERGGSRGDAPQYLDRRLYFQLSVFTGPCSSEAMVEAASAIPGAMALYASVHDPEGWGLLVASEDPADFVDKVRPLLRQPPFRDLGWCDEDSMFGRTYSIGYETDLEDTLLGRPRRTALNPDWPWAIWYPLRRSGAFEMLSTEEQRAILGEHGAIGRSFGEHDLAHDIRLACQGLDRNDNDFVVGLTGKSLHPLSAIVQRMRGTRQTSEYLLRLGPFFVGKAVWKAPL